MRFFLLLILCLLAVGPVLAQAHRDEFGVQSDNDSYLASGSDRYYTNGLFFYFNHALPVKKGDSTSLQNKVLGFEIGQKMYNAQAGFIPSSIYIDRPFAGYLYIAPTLNFLFKNESNIKISAQLGVVGPASLAQAAQEGIHKLLNQYTVGGWQYQIKNDPELNLSMAYNKLLARDALIDVSLASYANLGNGFSGAGVGPLLRIGNFNQLFHSQTTQSNVTANDNIKPLHAHEFFLYYKPQINWIAYDATIKGGLLESHNDQDAVFFNYVGEVISKPEPFIFSNLVGAAYSSNRWTFDLSATFETKDTKEMVHDTHQWGSVQVLYRFH